MTFSHALKRASMGTLSALLAMGGASVALAPIASAADSSINCASFSNTSTNVPLTVGATYTIANSGVFICTLGATSGASGTVSWISSDGSDTPTSNPTRISAGATLTVTAVTAGTLSLSYTGNNANLFTFTVTGVAPSPSPTTASSDSLPPWLQSYGRLPAQGCKPGWHASWAEWAVAKTGGWVCNRTVYWNGSEWMQDPDSIWVAANSTEATVWDGQ